MKRFRVVYTAGTWDLFHYGHLHFLRESAALAERLVVGVFRDKGTLEYKGRLPVIPEDERLAIVQSLPFVTLAIYQNGRYFGDNLQVIRPDAFTHGTDLKAKDQHPDDARVMRELGVRWIEVRRRNIERLSTTAIRKRLTMPRDRGD